MRPIRSIHDARLLGIVDAARAAFPRAAGVPAAKALLALLARRNDANDDEISAIDAAIVKLVVAQGVPDYEVFCLFGGGGDYNGRAPVEVLRGVMQAAGWTGSQAGKLAGVDGRTIRRWLASADQPGASAIPYAAWYTLIHKSRSAS